MEQLRLPVRPAKSVREFVRERLADLNLRQAERERRRARGRRTSARPAPAVYQYPLPPMMQQ
jgi:hypothetical protein